MAINHYFQGGRGIGNNAEQRLHEDLIIEGLKIYGTIKGIYDAGSALATGIRNAYQAASPMLALP